MRRRSGLPFGIAVLVGAALLAGIAPATAQTTIPLKNTAHGVLVDVPFAFVAADRQMPAGRYEITTHTTDYSVLMVRGVGGNPVVVSVTTAAAPKTAAAGGEQAPRATFATYFGHYFLQQVTVGSHVRAVNVTQDRARRLLAQLNLGPNVK